jgi:nucleoside-diphosphate-sugar epimerase
MRILITGATGFVGTSLLAGLANASHELYGLARSQATARHDGLATFLQGDVTDPQSLQGIPAGLDLVIHCAGLLGKWGRTWRNYYTTNVIGTKNIAAVCQQKDIRNLIHISSGGTLSRATKYEESKYLSEDVLRSFIRHIKVLIVRPEFLYGPGDLHVERLFRAIRSKRFAIIGDGESTVHPTFITDLVSHMQRLVADIDHIPSGATYTIAGPQMTWNNFVKTVCAHYEIQPRFRRIPVPIMRWCALLNEALTRILGFPMLINREQVYFFSVDHGLDTNTTILHCPTPLVEGLRDV